MANSAFSQQNPATKSVKRPGGRLTLVSGTPVMTSEQASKTSIYYTPYAGNHWPKYTGTWSEQTFSELTLALDNDSGHTGYHQSGKLFDLFLYDDAGTLRLVSGPAWTSDTARATALEYVNGILMNAASMTARFGSASGNTVTVAQDRGVYVGTFLASANGTLTWELGGAAAGGDPGRLYLWNCYNRVQVSIAVQDNTDSWTDSAGTWGAFNGNTNNSVTFVRGLNEDSVLAHMGCVADCSGGAAGWAVGLDQTTAPTGTYSTHYNNTNSSFISRGSGLGQYTGQPGIGKHICYALDLGVNVFNAPTLYGDAGTSSQLSGLHFTGWF